CRPVTQRPDEYGEVLDRVLGQQQDAVVGAEPRLLEESGNAVGQRVERPVGERLVLIDTVDVDPLRPAPRILGDDGVEGATGVGVSHGSGSPPEATDSLVTPALSRGPAIVARVDSGS